MEETMLKLAADHLIITVFIVLIIAIYAVILAVFFSARRKYRGGIVEKAIFYLIATIVLFLLSDIALFLVASFGIQWGYGIHLILKIVGMICLAKAGLEFFAS
jgi:ABC-type proline/glycine betaine transport system permease subunit